MNTWKMLSGLASMLAAAAVLTSVLTIYKDGGSSTAGLLCLGFAALVLGLAGIVQIVFRDGLIGSARIVTVALFALAAILFLVTAIVAYLDANGKVQIITLIVWSAGCAAFAYVDYVWAYDVGSDKHLAEQAEISDSDEVEAVSEEDTDVVSEAEEISEDDSAEDVDGSTPEDMPELPDVEISDETQESDDSSLVDKDLSWDGVSGPPPRL